MSHLMSLSGAKRTQSEGPLLPLLTKTDIPFERDFRGWRVLAPFPVPQWFLFHLAVAPFESDPF
jgi:hypothetical protein